MVGLLEEHLGFKIGDLKLLDGYHNLNYCIEADARKYIFKTYSFSDEMHELIEAENNVLQFLSETGEKHFPEPVCFDDRSKIKTITLNGDKKLWRLLTYLDGEFLGSVSQTPEVIALLGRFLAGMDLRLQQYKPTVYKGRKWEWDIQYLGLNRKYIGDIRDAHNQNLVRYFLLQFEEKVVPIFPDFRKSLIHNDVNDWNILVRNGEVSGLIDFGDMTYSALINEVAVAATYVCYDKGDQLKWIGYLIKAYHEILPFEKFELDILYYLIGARLCISVCNSAHAKKVDSKNEYAGVSEKLAWKTHRTVEPNTQLAQILKNRLRDQHILISTDGPFDSVLKSKPPLCFTKANAKTVVENIEMVLKKYD